MFAAMQSIGTNASLANCSWSWHPTDHGSGSNPTFWVNSQNQVDIMQYMWSLIALWNGTFHSDDHWHLHTWSDEAPYLTHLEASQDSTCTQNWLWINIHHHIYKEPVQGAWNRATILDHIPSSDTRTDGEQQVDGDIPLHVLLAPTGWLGLARLGMLAGHPEHWSLCWWVPKLSSPHFPPRRTPSAGMPTDPQEKPFQQQLEWVHNPHPLLDPIVLYQRYVGSWAWLQFHCTVKRMSSSMHSSGVRLAGMTQSTWACMSVICLRYLQYPSSSPWHTPRRPIQVLWQRLASFCSWMASIVHQRDQVLLSSYLWRSLRWRLMTDLVMMLTAMHSEQFHSTSSFRLVGGIGLINTPLESLVCLITCTWSLGVS